MPHKSKERQGRRVLNNLVWSQIRERRMELSRGAVARNDFLGALMALRDDEDAGGGLGDEEIRDQCMTMFLGGHDTTASALTWWGFAMASNPECARRAAAEVDTVLGQRLPAYEDIPKLEYLNRTLQETMRLYPPFAILISRRAMQSVSIGNWTIPKGAAVMLSPWVVHRDARWFPDPERFDPDRFTEESTGQRPRGAFLPFGAGPRVCIGNIFALTQMTLVSAMVLQRYQFRSVATAKAADNPTYNFTLRPARGMQLELSKRLASTQ
jgi:cytochrome P450